MLWNALRSDEEISTVLYIRLERIAPMHLQTINNGT